MPQPMVALAPQPDLEYGFARDLFTLWSTDCRNCVILPQRCSAGTLAHEILNSPRRYVKLEIRQRIELEGGELSRYLEQQQELAERKEIQSDSESSDEGVEMGVGRRKHTKALVPQAPTFFKELRKTHPMFPAPVEQRLKCGEYGQIINPEEYIPIVDTFNECKREIATTL
ncbi:putative cleavage and polyadenylation specificity factor subunit 2, partial [Fragariocoptes setiger]